MSNEEGAKPARSGFKGNRKGGFKGQGKNGGSGGYKGNRDDKSKTAGGFKGKGQGRKSGFSKDGAKRNFGDKPAWKKGDRKFDRDGAKRTFEGGSSSTSDSRDESRGSKPGWRKDGFGPSRNGGYRKGGEKRGYNKDRRDDSSEGSYKKSFRKDSKHSDRKDDRGDFRKGGAKRRFDDASQKGYSKDHADSDASFEKRSPKRDRALERQSRTAEIRNEDQPLKEKRGDKFLRSDFKLASKKERDAAQLAREDNFVYAGDHVMSRKAKEGIFLEIGESVKHEVYGEGVVRKVTGGKAGVEFDGQYRWFAFPSCIENGVLKRAGEEELTRQEQAEETDLVQEEPVESERPLTQGQVTETELDEPLESE